MYLAALVVSAAAAALVPPLRSTARSVVSVVAPSVGAEPLAALERAGERVVRLVSLSVDDGGRVSSGEAAEALQRTVGWVHVACDFKELVCARRAGATTIWLNSAAAATAGDLETQGYFATAIIDDYADAVCACPGDLAGACDEARKTRAMRKVKSTEKEEQQSGSFVDAIDLIDLVEDEGGLTGWQSAAEQQQQQRQRQPLDAPADAGTDPTPRMKPAAVLGSAPVAAAAPPAIPPPPPAAVAAAGAGAKSAKERMQELKELLDACLISQDEFDGKRQEILDSL